MSVSLTYHLDTKPAVQQQVQQAQLKFKALGAQLPDWEGPSLSQNLWADRSTFENESAG